MFLRPSLGSSRELLSALSSGTRSRELKEQSEYTGVLRLFLRMLLSLGSCFRVTTSAGEGALDGAGSLDLGLMRLGLFSKPQSVRVREGNPSAEEDVVMGYIN